MSQDTDDLRLILCAVELVLGARHPLHAAISRAIMTGRRADIANAWAMLRTLRRDDHKAIIDQARRLAGIAADL